MKHVLCLAFCFRAVFAVDMACNAENEAEEATLLQGTRLRTADRHSLHAEEQAVATSEGVEVTRWQELGEEILRTADRHSLHAEEQAVATSEGVEVTRWQELGEEIRDFQREHQTITSFPQMAREEKQAAEEFMATLADDLAEDFREMAAIHEATIHEDHESNLLEMRAAKGQVESSRRRWFRRRREGIVSIITDNEIGETIIDCLTGDCDGTTTTTTTTTPWWRPYGETGQRCEGGFHSDYKDFLEECLEDARSDTHPTNPDAEDRPYPFVSFSSVMGQCFFTDICDLVDESVDGIPSDWQIFEFTR